MALPALRRTILFHRHRLGCIRVPIPEIEIENPVSMLCSLGQFKYRRSSMRIISLLLITVLAVNGFGFVGAAAVAATPQNQAQRPGHVDRIKGEVQMRGTGERARVRVARLSGTEVKGYISSIDESSFTVTNKQTGQATTISYADTRSVRGPGLSRGAKIGIAVAVGVAVTATVIAVGLCTSLKNAC
jgi:hypothetical protein